MVSKNEEQGLSTLKGDFYENDRVFNMWMHFAF